MAELKIAAAVLCLCAGALSAVRVSEETITLPTWAEDPPDIMPVFDGNYPYPLRNGITQQKNEEGWRVLVLENEYLRCRILPDLGGRLYSCTDKRNNREMFFANSSIRKAAIGLRGAWVAAGLEANFPIGHSRDSVSPVDYAMRQNADGSGSVITGTTDRVSGMRWQTEFVLHPGSAAVEEHVTLYNPTATPHRYHWWNDASVLYRDPKTRFILPTMLVSTHNASAIDTWPVSTKGIDNSVVANAKNDAAWFSWGSKELFAAIYEPGSRTGTVHVAGADVLPGKKMYTWGVNGNEQVRRLLTDDRSTYVEMQAGLFQNQDTFQMLGPQTTQAFTEYWSPVRDLGGISRASRDALLYLDVHGGSLAAALEVTRALPHARITLTQNGHALLEDTADLDPAHAWSKTAAGFTAGAECRFELHDAAGTLLLGHTLSSAGKDEYDALTPDRVRLGEQPKPDLENHGTEDGFLRMGSYYEIQANLALALRDYESGLKRFPDSVLLHLAKGRLAVTLLRFPEAVRELTWLREKAKANLEARHYLGAAFAGEGNDATAEPELRAALQSDTVGHAAAVELGGVLARRGDLGEAIRQFHVVAEQDPNAVRAASLEIATLRRQRRLDAARERVRVWLARAPQDSMLRAEAVLLGAHDDALWPHLGANPERVLDIAADYIFLGSWNDALALLSRQYPASRPNETEPGSVLPQQNPLVAYYRAYCRMRLAQSPAADLRAAASMSVKYVFPHRACDLTVMTAVLRTADQDGAAHLLAGYLYMFGLDQPRAVEEWHRAEILRPDLPALAGLLAKTRLAALTTAPAPVVEERPGTIAPAPVHPVPGNTAGVPARTPRDPRQIAANALLRSISNLDDAVGVFNDKNFPGEKQDEFVRRVWIELQLQRVRAIARSGNCDAALTALETMGDEVAAVPFTIRGFGSFVKEPRMQFYTASIEFGCGREKAAKKRLEHVAKERGDETGFSLLAALRLGDPDATAAAEAAVKGPAQTATQLYGKGMLLAALGKRNEARSAFEEGTKAPGDEFARYLNLRALSEVQ